MEKGGLPQASNADFLAESILLACRAFQQSPKRFCLLSPCLYYLFIHGVVNSIGALVMDGAANCKAAANQAGMMGLYRRCFVHTFMLALKANQHVFPWLNDVLLLIRLICRNGILNRGLLLVGFCFSLLG